ncbi:hypothetical protein [Vibrio pectenicida]|uniref:hypothetical protein n=1 Tax=Vibrio pectenicida TaxID=62763 RepID=UPI001639FE20|nr:hypothetical protein [Vibrio pectenicida]
MKLDAKNIGIIAGIAALVAAGVVWASNNVDAVTEILNSKFSFRAQLVVII